MKACCADVLSVPSCSTSPSALSISSRVRSDTRASVSTFDQQHTLFVCGVWREKADSRRCRFGQVLRSRRISGYHTEKPSVRSQGSARSAGACPWISHRKQCRQHLQFAPLRTLRKQRLFSTSRLSWVH